jgi:alginate O-acetyltransferase complex protein AlgI
MTFTSLYFFLFFAIVCAVYWLLRTRRRQNLFLLLASYAFYFYFDLLFGLLLIASSAADYFLARGMVHQPERRKTYLWLSLALNLGGLALLRYFDFFSGSLAALLNSLGWQADPLLLGLAAPLGISFFTLKKLSYSIDVYKGTFKPGDSFVDFGLYVAFFPQIQAGPIDRARNLLAQIGRERFWGTGWFDAAWPLLVSGLFKKLVIAAGVGSYVDRIFLLDKPSLLMLAAGSLGYTLQILADFSAYTDLARSFSFLLGFDTPENFTQPYAALSPTEFWNRWHITFSTWLRDYIFFPLRRVLLRAGAGWAALASVLPPMAAMLASGLWHGTGWTFLLWGAMHGLWIVAYQLLGLGGAWQPRRLLGRAAAWLAMMAFLVPSWAVFRAPSLDWLWGVLRESSLRESSMLGGRAQGMVVLITLTAVWVYGLLWGIQPLLAKLWKRVPILEPLYYAAALVLAVIYANPGLQDFIYFRF